MRNLPVIALFILLLLCGVLLIAIGNEPSVANAVGMAHGGISGMRAGGDGAARLSAIGSYAFLFQALVMCCACAFFVLGVSERKRDRKLFITLACLLAISEFVWFKVYQEHWTFLASKTTAYFLAFPTATAWMLYGVGICGALFIAFYCIGFRQYIYSDADAKAFAELSRETTSDESEPQNKL